MGPWFDEIAELRDAFSVQLSRVVREAERLGEDASMAVMRAWEQLEALSAVPPVFQIPPVRRQFYGHGAYMGAAPALLADEHWRRILAFLMPDVYADVQAAVEDDVPTAKLIPMFENNPVMAAYGVWHSVRSGGDGWVHDNVGIEWDLFIDGDLAEAHVNTPAEQRPALVAEILSSSVIAHAGALDTVQENLGFCQHSDVRDTAKAALGGVEVGAWLDLFARALRLASADAPTLLLRKMAAEPRVTDGDVCVRHTFVRSIPPREVVETFCAITGRQQLSVVLDMKSLRSTPALFADIICALNDMGVHVAAACSFKLEEVAGLSKMVQRIDGAELPGPREVLFFHYAGGVQRACDASPGLPPGTSVLFNGASLLELDGWFSGNPKYIVNEAVVADLARYQQRHELQIGLYVQEGDCDSGAAALLAGLVEQHPETFALGFAWGGLRDLAAFEVSVEPRMGHGSQIALAFFKTAWQLPDD